MGNILNKIDTNNIAGFDFISNTIIFNPLPQIKGNKNPTFRLKIPLLEIKEHKNRAEIKLEKRRDKHLHQSAMANIQFVRNPNTK